MSELLLMTAEQVLFQGRAQRVIFPGEAGIFEVGPFHRPLMSRLLPGLIEVDEKTFAIHRGVVKVERDTITSIVETKG